MRPCFVVPVAVAAVAFGAGACGGDDKLPKAEFVSKANAICAKYEKKISAVPEPSRGDDNLDRYADYVDKVSPLAKAAHAEMSDLEPEDGALAKKWDGYLEGVRTGIDDLEAVGEKAEDDDRPGAQAAAKRLTKNDADAKSVLGEGACAN